ncbi:MAG: SGNH/GDSL hydrolase family protein [Actinobacteria bacterium]|nr:SGNH/GDSL hydrolase family protein [Actinomycetota bacterium]
MKSLVVLGDSVGFGVGDEDNMYPNKGVGAFLHRSLPGFTKYANHSRPGARMREVFEVQLPKALEHEPDVVVLIAGGNDVLRQNFDPTDIYWSMYGTITTLKERGVEVLTMKLHDPNRKIRLPKRLARLLHQRVETLNHIIDDVSQLLGAQCLDVRKIDLAYDQRIWHIDRMHPNRTGYHLLATHFARLLHGQGHDVRDVTAPLVRTRSRKENVRWMLRMGLPWFLKRCKDLFPGVGYLLVLETSKDVARALRKRRGRQLPTGHSERRFAHLDTTTEHRGGIETNFANRPSQAAA